jgi:predicted transglutaminase-like cysteine proteinase
VIIEHAADAALMWRSALEKGTLGMASATPEQLAQLQSVNETINEIPFNAIPGAYEPVDWWTDTPIAGNSFVCRDYVLCKAEKLKALGWAPSALTVTLCYVETGEYHAVLTVDDGEPQPWVLDSRFGQIYRMDQPPAAYRWDRRQVAGTTEFESIA